MVSTSVNCTSSTAWRIEVERSLSTLIVAAGRQLLLERRQHRLDGVDDLDRVGVGLALHGEHDGALAVVPARGLVVLDRIDDARDVAQAHRMAVARSATMMLRKAAALASWVLAAMVSCWLVALQRADRRVVVGRRDGGLHLVDADAARGQRRRVELDAHRVFLAAEDQHLRDAVDASTATARSRAAAKASSSTAARLALQRQQQDRRIGRVDLAVARRRRHLERQLPLRARDRRLHVGGGRRRCRG